MCEFVIGAIIGGGILAIVVMISLAKAAKYADEAESEMRRNEEEQ